LYLRNFLREKKYALLHDDDGKVFAARDFRLIRYSISQLQRRYEADELFKATSLGEYLGPLVARTPSHLFFKSPLTLTSRERDTYNTTSQPTNYVRAIDKGTFARVQFSRMKDIEPHSVLREECLFAKRFVDMSIRTEGIFLPPSMNAGIADLCTMSSRLQAAGSI
jgi:hypothetical protein